jgi:hypothetical protein
MATGRDLDRRVAARVLGRRPGAPCDGEIGWDYGYACLRCEATWSPDADRAALTPHPWEPPPYSTDAGAAWEVVDHLQAAGWGLVLALAEPGLPLEVAVVAGPTIRGVGPVLAVFHRGARHAQAGAATAPLAICRAALEAAASGAG